MNEHTLPALEQLIGFQRRAVQELEGYLKKKQNPPSDYLFTMMNNVTSSYGILFKELLNEANSRETFLAKTRKKEERVTE